MINYTTQIDAYKTISEISQTLAKAGAKKIIVDNDDNALPVSITFCLDFNGRLLAFNLPCRFENIHKILSANKKIPSKYKTKEQALRTGWRVIKVWIDAQLSIVESEIVTTAEVFMPYAITKTGKTLYEDMRSGGDILMLN